MYQPPAPDTAPPPAGPLAPHQRRSNWAMRLLACALSAAAFLGFWQASAHASAPRATATPSAASGQYAPPGAGQGGLIFGVAPDAGTHVS